MSIKQFKLKQVLEKNNKWPLILIGDIGNVSENFTDSIVLAADIDEKELHIPSWGEALTTRAKQGKVCLLIDGLDDTDLQNQEKFIGLLKDRRAGNYKLPDNVQIVISVKDESKLSDKIKLVALSWSAL